MTKIKRIFPISFILMCLAILFMTCDNATDPEEHKETKGSIKGQVWFGTVPIPSAYIFIADSFWTTTDGTGAYAITSIQEGNYNLLCSAINYRDTSNQVQVIGGSTVTCNFNLLTDTTTGYVKGEFQDITLFYDSLAHNPELAYWNAEQIYQGTTGATLISKYLQYYVPIQKIYLGDSLISITDDWAMFTLKIQSGTYPLTGKCDGYYDATEVVKVVPGKFNNPRYVTFFMVRNSTPKLAARRQQ